VSLCRGVGLNLFEGARPLEGKKKSTADFVQRLRALQKHEKPSKGPNSIDWRRSELGNTKIGC